MYNFIFMRIWSHNIYYVMYYAHLNYQSEIFGKLIVSYEIKLGSLNSDIFLTCYCPNLYDSYNTKIVSAQDKILYILNFTVIFYWFQFDPGRSNYSCLLPNWCWQMIFVCSLLYRHFARHSTNLPSSSLFDSICIV